MLTTLLPIDEGEAKIGGYDVKRNPKEVRRHIGYVGQLGGTDTEATGRENLMLSGLLYGMSKVATQKQAEFLIDLLDLREIIDRLAKTYSGGQRRRLEIALGILHKPDVLFLDEPTTGLDPQNRANLWEHIRKLKAAGMTVFLTTHYLEEADELCDRLCIMDKGVIVAEGTPLALQGVTRYGKGGLIMKILFEIWLLFKRKIMETIRQPAWTIMGLITPLLYITLFSPLLKNLTVPPITTSEVLNTFVPGILTLLAFGNGAGAGYLIINELQSGVIERLRVSPASRFSLLMGTVLRDIVTFLVPSILVILIAQLFGFHIHLFGLLLMFVLLSFLVALISAWAGSLGLIIKQVGSLATVLNGLQLPLTLLSGVLLPMSLAPKWLQIISHVNPLYYTVEASRVLASGIIDSPEVFKAFAVIVPLTIVTLCWATRVYRKAIA